VALSCEKPGTEALEEFKQLARDIAMQVAGAMPPPLAVNRDQVPKEWLAKEEEIAVAQARATGKPEAILKKIAEGKVQKALQEVSLMDQVYLKEPDLTVAKLLAKVGAQVQDKLTVTRFLRMKVGETK
jgi:elongation factor Ts